MPESVLAHVAATIPQKENLATSALVYILNRSQPARQAFHALVEQAVGTVAEIGSLRVEETLADGKRPDVLLLGPAGNRVGFMEVKFWAGLTEAQPVNYLEALNESDREVLVFLAPTRRLASLRNELIERCKLASMTTDVRSDVALDCNGIHVALIAWSQMMEQLGRSTIDDRQALADVEQLRGLWEAIETEGSFSLTREEADDITTPKRYLMLAQLASEAVERWVTVGTGSVKGLNRVNLAYGPGRYVNLGRAIYWLGLDHESWAKHGRSPIWLRFLSDKTGQAPVGAQALANWIRATPPRSYWDGAGSPLLVPAVLPATGTKEDAVNQIVDLIRDIENTFKASGIKLLDNAGSG